ncbi:MAG: VWA domain-containing protein [Planctomycetes bacterium]|nr:VWA domain-containing protein [Planctomycetota bacterium]
MSTTPQSDASPSAAVVTQQAPAATQPATAPAQQPAAEPPRSMADIDADFDALVRRRQMIQFGASCGVSMIVHAIALILLGLIKNQVPTKELVVPLVASVAETPEDLLNQVLEDDPEPSKTLEPISGVEVTHTGLVGMAAAALPSAPTMTADTSEVVAEAVRYDPGELNPFNQSSKVFAANVPKGTVGDAIQSVNNYQDAVDRITQEILTKLNNGKVLVIWCFDESESMLDDRTEITAKIDRVYAELGIATTAQGDQLLTSICSYGKDLHFLTTKPTADVKEIQAAIKKVPNDPSGQEQMCPAITTAVGQHVKYANQGRRQLMTIVVTDESGDPQSNWSNMEATIAECKSLRSPVYFLAREAVFGYPYGTMRYIDPETKTVHWLQIDRGPETPYAEQLQVDGFVRRYDAHASGFGPYAQTRIARETNGVFFMLPSPEVNLVGRDATKYNLETMRPYLPDLSTRSDYMAERDKHEFRKTLWRMIGIFNPYSDDKAQAAAVQVKWWNFAIDQPGFTEQAKENYAKAQKLIPMYEQAQKELEKVKGLRAREDSLRWRANYDLIYAQVLAFQVRLHEYSALLEKTAKEFKPPKDAKSNEWNLFTTARTLTDAKTKDLREKAIEALKYVAKEHEGTPYASRARNELARGFGVDIRDNWDDPRRRNVVLPKF